MESEPSTSTSTSTSTSSLQRSQQSPLQRSQQCRRFEFPEILLATNDFDESLVIGHGGFGKVYKGNVINGSSLGVAAIKRLDSMSNQGAEEFWTEVEMLSKLRHSNLVSLIGYCNYKKEMILVYEYMPNGTLEDHLHKRGAPLSWLQRLKICIGAARGLDYLHTGTGVKIGVIHRDVKSSNILLDESWVAKVSDFGLSRISPTNQTTTYVKTLVKGTFGYLDPDYYTTGKLTRKSDVYAFGVVLLEVLCRKRAVDSSLDEEQWNLARWAQESIKDGRLKHIIDSGIKGQISPKCLKEFVRIIERCLHNTLKKRSSMAAVVDSLESLVNLQQKFNNSLQPAGRTIFGRMFAIFGRKVDMIPVPSNRENSDPLHMLPASTDIKGNKSLKEFQFADLKKATSNFDRNLMLGEGGFGQVFLGWVDKDTFVPSQRGAGMSIAVKRINEDGLQGISEWQSEVNFLGKLAHPNIITILGYCINKQESLFLVYEYMQNGSLDRLLFTNVKPLVPWGTRVMIMIGVARGLTYLHSLMPQVILRDVKTSAILLDQDFNPKLGDFGFAKLGPATVETHVSTRVMGTYGYAAPEFMMTGHLTAKSDIYGFGVVLLETLTGLRVLDISRPDGQQSLVEWTRPNLASRKQLKRIMDPRLEHNYPQEAAFKCTELTLRCLEREPRRRPSSEEVLRSLEQIYALNK